MTISIETSRNDYTGDGALDTFAYGFYIFEDADLLVTLRDTDGIEATQTLNTHYTVTGAGSGSGGNVVFVTAPTLNYAITIRRVRDITQETDIRNQGPFYAESHEDTFDHLCMVDQQQQDVLDRSIKLPETEAGTAGATVLPQAADRANNVLGFDASGNISMVESGYSFYLYTVSPFMLTVLDDTSASAALTTLGVTAFAKTLLDDTSASAALTTLGVSTYVKTLLDDASADDAQTTLGISPYIKLLIDDTTASGARATLNAQSRVETQFDLSGLSITVDDTTPQLQCSGSLLVASGLGGLGGYYVLQFSGDFFCSGAGGTFNLSIGDAAASMYRTVQLTIPAGASDNRIPFSMSTVEFLSPGDDVVPWLETTGAPIKPTAEISEIVFVMFPINYAGCWP